MWRFLLQRTVSAVFALFFVATVTFFLLHAIPGGPFDNDKKLPPEILHNLEAKYHLNDPLWKQYTDYLRGLALWDLGPSLKQEALSVNDIIRQGFPVSATLGALAVSIALVAGVTSGVVAALCHNRWQDYLVSVLTALGFAVPNFIMAGLLVYIFAYQLRWFPPALWGTPAQAVLPALALAAGPTAVIARFMRSSLLEVLQQDYIRTAKAKGLSQAMVVYRHALRNAFIPVLSYLGPMLATVFTGSFVVERIFAIPGLGQYYVTGIVNRDYTLTLGVTVFYSVLLITMNLLADLGYVALDPRIRLVDRTK